MWGPVLAPLTHAQASRVTLMDAHTQTSYLASYLASYLGTAGTDAQVRSISGRANKAHATEMYMQMRRGHH